MRYLVLLLLASPLAAQQRKPIDYVLATATTGLIVADWSQTLVIAAQRHEGNPLLGSHPSRGIVNTFFAFSVLANIAAIALPSTPRRVWYGFVLSLETTLVLHNLAFGYRIGF